MQNNIKKWRKKTFEKLNEFDIMQQNMINYLKWKQLEIHKMKNVTQKKHCKSESADDIGKPPMKLDIEVSSKGITYSYHN